MKYQTYCWIYVTDIYLTLYVSPKINSDPTEKTCFIEQLTYELEENSRLP